MLAKELRLGKSKVRFTQVFTHPLFSFRVAKNNLGQSRFGFIVSKQVDKRAVVRNRVKRVFRSCIEEVQAETEKGYDMTFVLKKELVDKKRDEVYAEIISFLKQKKFLQ